MMFGIGNPKGLNFSAIVLKPTMSPSKESMARGQTDRTWGTTTGAEPTPTYKREERESLTAREARCNAHRDTLAEFFMQVRRVRAAEEVRFADEMNLL
jgi:hypothetical protein